MELFVQHKIIRKQDVDTDRDKGAQQCWANTWNIEQKDFAIVFYRTRGKEGMQNHSNWQGQGGPTHGILNKKIWKPISSHR